MTYLLDVSALIALLWDGHVHHDRVTAWQLSNTLATCPLTDLGFLRISTQPVFGATVEQTKKMLEDWRRARSPRLVPCAMRLATLDLGIKHDAVFQIP
jgi:predicted nucleic acid-binding protein